MSWKTALQYAKNIAEKNGLISDVIEDIGLPLGARIGGIINMQQSPFIRAVTDGSLIEIPTQSQSIIKAISRLQLNMNGDVYRYYLATGDDGGKEIFLQIYMNEQGDVCEAMYCTQLTRLIPETEEDQQIYMGLSGYGLGDKCYTLWREQLIGLGFGEADLHTAFDANDRLDYMRDPGNSDVEFISPFAGTETRLDDSQGMRGIKQEIYFMPYRREINENVEYLLITTEIVTSQDGDTSKRDIHVDFMVGIPVELERINIQ